MTMVKKPPEERKRIRAFSLDPEVCDWLEERTTRESRSAFVNELLLNHMGLDRSEPYDDIGRRVQIPPSPIEAFNHVVNKELPKKRGRPRKDKNDSIKRLEQELRK